MTEWPADKVERRAIGTLIPYAKNARTHSDAQVAQIAASMKEWGWTNPVLIDDAGMIIAGHGRVLAARILGYGEVPVMVATGWTEPQKKAYVLADNKLAMNAGWDNDLLKFELQDLDAQGFDLTLTGFELFEIEAFMQIPAQSSTAPIIAEDVLGHDCALGDVFRIGRHIIACGDSADVSVIDAVLLGDAPDLVMYDPPFEVKDAWSFLYPAARAVVFCDYKTAPLAISAGAGFDHCYHFVWDGVTSWYTPNRPLARHKSAFVFSKNPAWDFDAAVFHDGKERSAKTVTNTRGSSDYVPLGGGMAHLQTVYQHPNTQLDDGGHAHSKPPEWIRALMLGCGARIVLDQFAGSGGFAVAAPDGVSVRSIELDPLTCGRAIARIAAATGSVPERI